MPVVGCALVFEYLSYQLYPIECEPEGQWVQFACPDLPFQLKAVLPSKRLQGRTYRVGADSTLFIGSMARVDVLATPGSTVYLTVSAGQML